MIDLEGRGLCVNTFREKKPHTDISLSVELTMNRVTVDLHEKKLEGIKSDWPYLMGI